VSSVDTAIMSLPNNVQNNDPKDDGFYRGKKAKQGSASKLKLKRPNIARLMFSFKFSGTESEMSSTSTTEQSDYHIPKSPVCIEELPNHTPVFKRRNAICLELEENHFDKEKLKSLANQHRELITIVRREDIGIMYNIFR